MISNKYFFQKFYTKYLEKDKDIVEDLSSTDEIKKKFDFTSDQIEIADSLKLKHVKVKSPNQSQTNLKTIFLSHKHTDVSLVYSIIELFSSFNISVYVDWLDKKMPRITQAKTGSILKEIIHKSDKFIFLATNNAMSSTWCNWELGLGDATKFSNDSIAIFPFLGKTNWKGSEYMGIYPTIYALSKEAITHLRQGSDNWTEFPDEFSVYQHNSMNIQEIISFWKALQKSYQLSENDFYNRSNYEYFVIYPPRNGMQRIVKLSNWLKY